VLLLLVLTGVGLVVLAIEEPDDATLIALAVAHVMLTLLVLVWREDTTGDPLASREALVRVLALFVPVTGVVVLTFTLTPGLARRLFRPPSFAQAGFDFGAEMRPGDIARVALSTDVVFRAWFPGGHLPEQESLYWRGATYARSEGLRWTLGTLPRSVASDAGSFVLPPAEEAGEAIRQEIVIEPRPSRLVFGLDWPYGVVVSEDDETEEGGRARQVTRLPGNTLLPPPVPPRRRLLATVTSSSSPLLALTQRERELYLGTAFVAPPGLSTWISGIRDNAGSYRELEAYLATRFRQEGFVYSLSPGTLDEPTPAANLEAFLTREKRGFCEHYAGALATLLRYGGVPSRVVVGFQGGVRNSSLSVVTVRDAEAHAWVEAFETSSGRWRRLDATAWIAADRIGRPIENMLSLDAPSASRWTRDVTRTIAGWTEPVRALWAFTVAGVRERDSLRLAGDLVRAAWRDNAPGFLGALAIMVGVGYAALVLARRASARFGRDAADLNFAQFKEALRAAHCPVETWQGPCALAEVVARELPACAADARAVAHDLARVLYAAPLESHNASTHSRLAARLRVFKRELKRARKRARVGS
jgi:transglutaminase-like putative cysteine protease